MFFQDYYNFHQFLYIFFFHAKPAFSIEKSLEQN